LGLRYAGLPDRKGFLLTLDYQDWTVAQVVKESWREVCLCSACRWRKILGLLVTFCWRDVRLNSSHDKLSGVVVERKDKARAPGARNSLSPVQISCYPLSIGLGIEPSGLDRFICQTGRSKIGEMVRQQAG